MGELFIQSLQSDPPYFFAVVITVVISITLHELAHGWVAIKLGDQTPIYSGHMTLNPLVHMGLFSIILLALAGIAFGAMPVDRTRLRGKYGEALMAAAGPAMNLLLAILTLTALALWQRFDSTPMAEWSPVGTNGRYLLLVFGLTNLVLAMFNLLPLPPLDGGWIAANLFPSYRRLLSSEVASGVAQALFFVMFLGAGTFIERAAEDGTTKYVNAVSGRPPYHVSAVFQRLPITNPAQAEQYDALDAALKASGMKWSDFEKHIDEE